MQQSNLARKASEVKKQDYNLEQFEQKIPSISKVPRRQHVIHPVQIVLTAVLIVAAAVPMLYGHVQLNELNQQINAAAAELDTLHSEKVRMETELEGLLSLKSIEEISMGKYGMVKPSTNQVTYLEVQKNRIETVKEEKSLLDEIKAFFKGLKK